MIMVWRGTARENLTVLTYIERSATLHDFPTDTTLISIPNRVYFDAPLGRGRERGMSVDLSSVDDALSAMTITGSMNEEGLGLVSWWE